MPFNHPERHHLCILWDLAPVYLTVSDFFLNVYLLYSDFLINKHMYILYGKTFWFPVNVSAPRGACKNQSLKKDILYIVYFHLWKRIKTIIKNINYTKIIETETESLPLFGWVFRMDWEPVITVFIIQIPNTTTTAKERFPYIKMGRARSLALVPTG